MKAAVVGIGVLTTAVLHRHIRFLKLSELSACLKKFYTIFGRITLSGQGDTRFCTTDLRFCVVTVTWRTPVRRVPVPCRIANLRCRTPLDLNRRILAAGKATDGGVLDVRRLTLTPPAVKRRWLRRVCPCPLRVSLSI